MIAGAAARVLSTCLQQSNTVWQMRPQPGYCVTAVTAVTAGYSCVPHSTHLYVTAGTDVNIQLRINSLGTAASLPKKSPI
jgi:hypothetical protein